MSLITPDFGLFFWMTVSFLVVFGLLAKFGFPAITGMVSERKKFIDDAIAGAKEANERLANIKIESESILQQAREQQATILKDATQTRDAIIKEAKDRAHAEGVRLLEEARQQILLEKQNAIRDIRAQVAELSVNVAERILRQPLEDDQKQMEMIDRLLDEANVSRNK